MNDIWNLMKKYRFNIVNDTSKNILCTICNGLMINAHSGPCGCVYCFDCIREYLGGMEKSCPGKTDDCKEEMLNINKNVDRDNRINKKVLKTIVKCPDESCVFEDELRNIENHIRVCDSQSVECPFMNIGCKDVNIVKTDLKKHVLEEIVCHSKLLLESMDNVKNEMELLKKNMTALTMENTDLKGEIMKLKAVKNLGKIKDLESKIKNQGQEINEMKKKSQEREIKCEHYDILTERINEMSTSNIFLRSKITKNEESILMMKDKMKETETNSMKELELIKNDMLLNKNIVENIKIIWEEEKEKIISLMYKDNTTENKFENDRNSDEVPKINNDLMVQLDNGNESIERIENCNKGNVDELRMEIETIGKTEMTNKKLIEELQSICDSQGKQLKELKEKIEMRRNELEKGKKRSDQADRSISNIDKKLIEVDKILCLQIGGEFVWRIEKLNEKLERARSGKDEVIYSDPFFSHRNGYKLCLQLFLNGNAGGFRTHLSLYFCLMRGEFDDMLSWPFKYDVTFELINQITKQIHISLTNKYYRGSNEREIFQKPLENRNKFGWGNPEFFSLSHLSSQFGLCENDQLFIRCRVKIN